MEKFLDRNIEEHTLDEDYVKERRRLKLNQGLQESPMAKWWITESPEERQSKEAAARFCADEVDMRAFFNRLTHDERRVLASMFERMKEEHFLFQLSRVVTEWRQKFPKE